MSRSRCANFLSFGIAQGYSLKEHSFSTSLLVQTPVVPFLPLQESNQRKRHLFEI